MHVLIASVVDDEAVRQLALDTAMAGRQVTLVIPASDGRRSESTLGAVRVERVEIKYLLRDARRAKRLRRLTGMILIPPVDTEADRVRRVRIGLAAREAASLPTNPCRSIGLRRRASIAIRPALASAHGASRRSWRMIDRMVQSWGLGARWRKLLPEVDDIDLALGPLIDLLRPDVVHAIGSLAFPLAARSVARAHPKKVKLVLDMRWGTGLSVAADLTTRQEGALRRLVAEHTRIADAVLEKDDDLYLVNLSQERVPISPLGSSCYLPHEVRRTRATLERVVGIGVENSAGQGWAWMQAIRQADPSIMTEVLSRQNGLQYRADVVVTRKMYEDDLCWGLTKREQCRERWTHGILESGNPLFGCVAGKDPNGDIDYLRSGGVRVALLFHGSDVRDPVKHAEMHKWSPFKRERREVLSDGEKTWDEYYYWVRKRNLELQRGFDGPIFVSTPDLLGFVPRAVWLPLVVDLWEPPVVPAPRPLPLVVHAPTNPQMKGTPFVDIAARKLAGEGLIEYRRVTGLSNEAALGIIRTADIVIDQLLLGAYGVLACEAMASGAAVIGYLGDEFRSRIPGDIPILEANPDSLESVLRSAVADIEGLRAGASRRRAFVETWHSGVRSARILLEQFVGEPEGGRWEH